jgi:hypothetical protein
MATYANSLTEGLGLTGSPIAGIVVLLIDTLGFNDVLTPEQVLRLIETLGLGETLDHLIQAKEHVTEEIGFADTIRFIWSILLTEGLGFNDPLTATPAKYATIVETLALSGYATTTLQAHNLIQAALGLSDQLIKAGIGELITEGLGFTGNFTDLIRAYQKVSEEFSLNETLAYRVAMIVAVSDSLGLNSTISTSAQVVELIQEGIIFTTSFVYGGETYTGWVMNSENFAVTQYKQYDFNSLCKLNGQYFGMQADGLYLLEGDTDDASYIKAVIRSPKMDLGTSSLKTITQAYIGLTCDNDLVMKIITDDKTEMWYTCVASDTGLHTDRLRLAKGVIGRYWQFEIVTQNVTELEIDTIELFPIRFGRKI